MTLTDIDSFYENCSFFVVTPVNFEAMAEKELKIKWPFLTKILKEHFYQDNRPALIINKVEGGLEVSCSFLAGALLNLFLKIPTRILLRINSFKCKDFPSLYKKVQKLPWKFFINDQMPAFKISCHQSRLIHTGRIEKTFQDGIQKYFQRNPPKKDSEGFQYEVYVRFSNDVCTLSLDISGEMLYKRGLSKKTHTAPIRDNLASGLILKLLDNLDIENGKTKRLIDPMMGSGTFLIEGINFYQLSNKRSFSFEKMKYFNHHFGSVYQKFKKNDFLNGPILFKEFYGFDKNNQALEMGRHNLKDYKKSEDFKINLGLQDIFSDSAIGISERNNFDDCIILNPPYGKRIKVSSKMKSYYLKLINQIITLYSPKILGILIPKYYCKNLDLSSKFLQYKVIENFSFNNGSIGINFFILKKLTKL